MCRFSLVLMGKELPLEATSGKKQSFKANCLASRLCFTD